MSIEIPKRFQKKLSHQATAIVENVSDYFYITPYYFEEYTDHGIRHVNTVLDYADKLIPQDSFEELTETDIDTLVLGICLHDLGMFIKESGLEYLLAQNAEFTVDENTNRKVTWKSLWDNHISRVKHSSYNELEDIFGDKEPVFDISSRPFCGSFIRRYHHLIAFFIAVSGFPGKEAPNDVLCGIDEDNRKLIGLLAKSHGMTMRSLKAEIDDFGYDNNLPLNVPIYYLMAVLRLADLLDADSSRAPKIISDMNTFSSKRSENEWTLNQLIGSNGRQWPGQTQKPETMKIIAKPKNSVQYLELKSWFDYWQKELDLSWSVIGEMHGDKYKMSVRRITSNIFDEKYISRCRFVTNPISLKVNPAIVNLLIEPLYGDDPSYGVRELLQNAIDACNERTEIDSTPGEISVDIDTIRKTFTITDNGIGMNENVIANYFLTAGASYRDSREWKESFTDEKAKPTVVRSGRFGIGALAAFLLGESAKVTTRHINDEKGYYFEYSAKPELLNVTRIEKDTPGTSIKVKMNEEALKKLPDDRKTSSETDWVNWYHLKKPPVTFRVDGKALKPGDIYDIKECEDTDDWFYYPSSAYDSFHWTVVPTGFRFICNGIHIPLTQKGKYGETALEQLLQKHGYYGDTPCIAVVDKKGDFPLNLARNHVSDSFEVEESFIEELCKFRIAKLLVYGNEIPLYRFYRYKYIYNPKGFLPMERSFLLRTNDPIFLIGYVEDPDLPYPDMSEHEASVGIFIDSDFLDFYRNMDLSDYLKSHTEIIAGDLLMNSVEELWADSTAFESGDLKDDLKGVIPERAKIHKIIESEEWYKDIPLPELLFDVPAHLMIRYSPTTIREGENIIMYKMLERYLPKEKNGGWIPIDEKEREEMYGEAYSELERYIKPLRRKKEEEDFFLDRLNRKNK